MNEEPAFPMAAYSQNQATGESVFHYGSTGLTLLDYFATEAMAALIAEPMWGDGSSTTARNWTDGNTVPPGAPMYAKAAYIMADAMMKERQNYFSTNPEKETNDSK